MVNGNKIRQLGLGTDMRELRQRSGMSTRAVAGRLGVSRMAVHRTESGKRTVPAEEVIAMCALYGVTGRDRERLVERATRGDNDASWLATGAAFSDQTRSLVALEARASMFTEMSVVLVPGLLQTPEYMNAIVQGTADAEVVAKARLARQDLLRSSAGPRFRFLIDELALRRVVGSAAIMWKQLEHLLSVGSRDNVAVHVIPAAAGAHAGVGGTFIVLDFPEQEQHAYVESVKTGVILSKPQEVRPFIDVITELDHSVILDEQSSAELIEALEEELADGRVGMAQEQSQRTY